MNSVFVTDSVIKQWQKDINRPTMKKKCKNLQNYLFSPAIKKKIWESIFCYYSFSMIKITKIQKVTIYSGWGFIDYVIYYFEGENVSPEPVTLNHLGAC